MFLAGRSYEGLPILSCAPVETAAKESANFLYVLVWNCPVKVGITGGSLQVFDLWVLSVPPHYPPSMMCLCSSKCSVPSTWVRHVYRASPSVPLVDEQYIA